MEKAPWLFAMIPKDFICSAVSEDCRGHPSRRRSADRHEIGRIVERGKAGEGVRRGYLTRSQSPQPRTATDWIWAEC